MNMIFYKNITAPSYPIILCQIMQLLQEQWRNQEFVSVC